MIADLSVEASDLMVSVVAFEIAESEWMQTLPKEP